MSEIAQELDTLVSHILLKAENQHELLFGDCESDVSLTNTQEHILMLLSQDRFTNSELAKILNVSQAAITKAIKGLIKQELLTSTKNNDDARITYFELTSKAQYVADEHSHHHDKTLTVYKELLDEFSENEQLILSKFIHSFTKKLESIK